VILRAFSLLLCVVSIPAGSAGADEDRVFVEAEASMPMYQIGPIQIDTRRQRQATPQVVVQWRMVRPGVVSPTVRAITGDRNMILILAGVPGNRSGTLRFDYEGSTRQPAVVAVWFEINRVRKPSSLISNISTYGKIDRKRLPQLAGAVALEEFADKDRRLPPTTLPEGFVPLLRNHAMAPGMRGKAAHENKWFDAEVLAVDIRGWLTVKYDDPDESIRLLPTLPTGDTSFFIVRPSTISAVRRSPRKFRASMNVLPGTIAEMPEDYVPLLAKELPPGLPVKFAFSNGWRDGLVVQSDLHQVEVQTRLGGKTEVRKVARYTLIVSTADSKILRRRNGAQSFKTNLEDEPAEE